ncbi:pseudaminic acid cytidylyltransferase [Donghicola sp. XS_ASV15]|uniref:pseudaminic acid cytidylyltransferase n=1 Tax=Donghicola sp. XS_ASV15 TaxID=3241295 RepID=UPI0035121F49
MAVCVIPARGGSKRIPHKNIKPFCGQPMIAWSIKAAQASGVFDQIVVSTDDDQIAQIAQSYGADVPFRRDAVLSDDHAPTVPVIADATERLALAAETPVCCLYATAPFVEADDIAQGLATLRDQAASYVMAVTTFPFPIQRALRRSEGGAVQMFDASTMQTRSQDLEEAWHDAGQFYWATVETWQSGRGVFEQGAHGVALPRHRVQDIDTTEDWIRAEYLKRALDAQAADH